MKSSYIYRDYYTYAFSGVVMSTVYIARQPIFGENMSLYGYELLYRDSDNNFFEGPDDDSATAILMDNFFSFGFYKLIDNTRGFINFSEKLLLSEAPTLLPPDKLVIEIVERTKVDEKVIEACKSLKEKGYTLALDDFVPGGENGDFAELLDYADIVKISWPVEDVRALKNLFKKYGHIMFLAEKIETDENYQEAQKLGFKLFQGYFFSKPVVINAKAIGALTNNLLPLLDMLRTPDPDINAITGMFERDLDLSYKLLRLVNSVYYGAKYTVKSINQAIIRMGTQELSRWVNLMMLHELQNTENAELVKESLIRGKMLALLSGVIGLDNYEPDFFITGIFSSIDALLGESMNDIVERLPLSDIVREALLGEQNILRRPLDAILNYENAKWKEVDAFLKESHISRDVLIAQYIDALEWQQMNAVEAAGQ